MTRDGASERRAKEQSAHLGALLSEVVALISARTPTP